MTRNMNIREVHTHCFG